MRVTIAIDCETPAFEPLPNAELARILRELAFEIECNTGNRLGDLKIKDIGGRKVGAIQVTKK